MLNRKNLARALSKIPDHPAPKSNLEQVRTPGDIAAMLVHEAYECGDIEDKNVLDLGCGTGVLAIGAAIMDAKDVIAIDVDKEALAVAEQAAFDAELEEWITFLHLDVNRFGSEHITEHFDGPADSTIMNPPFGADLASRARGGDRVFLAKAFQHTTTVYSLHAANTERFLSAFAADAGFEAARMAKVRYALPARFAHHQDIVRNLDVGLYRFLRDTP